VPSPIWWAATRTRMSEDQHFSLLTLSLCLAVFALQANGFARPEF
jgi:hypothetical protein